MAAPILLPVLRWSSTSTIGLFLPSSTVGNERLYKVTEATEMPFRWWIEWPRGWFIGWGSQQRANFLNGGVLSPQNAENRVQIDPRISLSLQTCKAALPSD